MNLVALPAFADNYIWMLHDGAQAVVVDPGDAAPVGAALDRLQLQLSAILVTHHHPDHVGGVDALRPRLHGPVYGPAREAIPQPFTPLNGGDVVDRAGPALRGLRRARPHGRPHRLRAARHPTAPLLFCGDTLFSAGCGRLFEGTPAQMHDSLSRLAALPGDTRVCCTHEYTLSNLRFAAAVEADNAAIGSHTAQCEALRAQGRPRCHRRSRRTRRSTRSCAATKPAVIAAARAQGAARQSRSTCWRPCA
jgi:hydroxyacylglutathione hydrolase